MSPLQSAAAMLAECEAEFDKIRRALSGDPEFRNGSACALGMAKRMKGRLEETRLRHPY